MIRLSTRRPVAVAMTYLAVALLGAAAWRNIPIELLPDTRLPRLSITASWPGASPETVEAFLTSPIEATVQQIRGVETVTSTSSEANASISVQFNRETDMDFARLDLSERIATLEEDLPPGVGQVRVTPYVPPAFANQANQAFLTYTLTGPYTLEALRMFIDDILAPEISQIQGVALVRVRGGRERLVEVELDEHQITSFGLTPGAVMSRIADLDLVREAGRVLEGTGSYTVTIRNRASSVRDIREAVLQVGGRTVIRVEDVAHVRDTYEEARSYYRIDGRPAVGFTLVKEIGANTVRVAEEVKARMARLEAELPHGTRVILDSDESEEIKEKLTDLRYRALVSAVVIFLVLLVFLRSFRSAAVVFATIVFSILIALNLIYFGGLSLNLLTLMGLAMGFGLIVDNSIVVLENVFRRWQQGEQAMSAAQKGAQQVALPILAATATTLIVFVPFVYLQGELRIYYVPLAIVVGLTLLASLFVAFSFIPALSGRILALGGVSKLTWRVGDTDGNGADHAGARPPIYVRFYSKLIRLTLSFPWLAVVVAAVCLGGSTYLFDRYVTRGRLWGGGGGQQTFVSITISLPRGSDLARTDELTRFFEERLAALPEVDRFVSNVDQTQGRIIVTFPEELEFTPIPPAIKEQMVAYSLGFSGADVFVRGFGPSFYGGGGSAPNYAIQILGYNYEEVRAIAEDMGSRLERISRIREVDTNSSGRYSDDKAIEFVVEIDREGLSRYDMSAAQFIAGLKSLIQGQTDQSTVKLGGEEIRFSVKTRDARLVDLRRLRESILSTPTGSGIRVGDVVTINPRNILPRISRENQQYERTIAYEFRGPPKLGDLVRDAAVEATRLPPGYSIRERDIWRFGAEDQKQIYFVLAVSVLLIFMVTAALFESFSQPLCVLLTVPMALIGVFLLFFYVNATFTREAYIGVIMMGGIVVNNAILLVDHINQTRRQTGLPLREAILTGTLERVRPILMTSTTTIIGMLPLVLFSQSVDSNIWNALAYALIGGLLSSTLFVLTTTPALYLLFEEGWARPPTPSFLIRGPLARRRPR